MHFDTIAAWHKELKAKPHLYRAHVCIMQLRDRMQTVISLVHTMHAALASQ